MRFFDDFGEKFRDNLQWRLGPLMSRNFPLGYHDVQKIKGKLENLARGFTELQQRPLSSILIQKVYYKNVRPRLKSLEKNNDKIVNLRGRFLRLGHRSSIVISALHNLASYHDTIQIIETQIALIIAEVEEMERNGTVPKTIDDRVSPVVRMGVIVTFLNLLIDSFQILLDSWPEEFLDSQMDLVSENVDKK
jgi:hypothetical protein